MGVLDKEPIELSIPLPGGGSTFVLFHVDLDAAVLETVIGVMEALRQSFTRAAAPAVESGQVADLQAEVESLKSQLAQRTVEVSAPVDTTELATENENLRASNRHLVRRLEEMKGRMARQREETRAATGQRTKTDLYREAAVKVLIENGKPMVRNHVAKAAGIPPGSSSGVFAHPAFKLEDDLLWLSDRADTVVKEQLAEEDDAVAEPEDEPIRLANTDDEAPPRIELNDQERRIYENIRARKERERLKGRA